MDNAAWGQWLKQRRRTLDLTQQALAQQVGCGVTTIRKYEAGVRKPSAEIADRLAQVLDVPREQRDAFVRQARGVGQPVEADPFTPRSIVSGRRTNLLTPLTSLVGREQDVARVRQLLSGGVRLLTLTGPPGIGKTRLSQQVAQEVLDLYSDGVFFIALALVTEPDHVLWTIAQALGVHEVGAESLLERLQALLHAREMLLVLDNLEQVLPAGPQLADLLAAAPRVQMLGTSRERLHLYGEQEYAVPPLALPALPAVQGRNVAERAWADVADATAVQLFIQRAQAANADFTLNRANARAVAELCIRLDGLPLAIELTAAGSRLFGPRALLARLVHRLDPLTPAARNLPPRQQTLRGAIQWSYELLDPAERLLFARLGVFVGGCTLESAEAVCNAEGDLPGAMLDRLASLVDKSLLRREEGSDEEPRFTMLETIREFAVEQLNEDAGGAPHWRDHHFRYYLALAEAAEPQITLLAGADSGVWLDRLDAEHSNVRAALQWSLAEHWERWAAPGLRLAAALFSFWEARRYLREGRDWLKLGLARVEPGSHSALRAKALRAVGSIARNQGDFTAARGYLAEALPLYRALGDQGGCARTLADLGWLASHGGDDRTALALRQEALALYHAAGDRLGVGNLLLIEGFDAWRRGEMDRVATLGAECLALFQAAGSRTGTAGALFLLALAALFQGDYAGAETLMEENMALRAAAGDHAVNFGRFILAEIALAQGHVERAATLYEEVLARGQESGEQGALAMALRGLGTVACLRGAYEQAEALHKESLPIYHVLRDSWGIAECLEGLAEVAAGRGQRANKVATLTRSARLWGAVDALRQATGHPVHPAQRARYEHATASARRGLGEERFAVAFAEGQALTLEQAIAYALAEQAWPHSTGKCSSCGH